MPLATAKIVLIDTSTLGAVARDYWSADESARRKARRFVADLTDRGIFIAFSMTHVGELLRHDNERVVRRRLEFLSTLPLVAWLRPYDRNWFPGCTVDLFAREIEAFLHGSALSWRELIGAVRPDLWETGNGSEIFIQSDEFWSQIRELCKEQQATEFYVSSVARTRVGGVGKLTMQESRKLPLRPREEWVEYGSRFAREVHRQLVTHGDARLPAKEQVAMDFSLRTFTRILDIDPATADPVQALIERAGVPAELVGPHTTVDELGELAIYVQQLRLIGDHLRPRRKLSPVDVPITALPAYVLERRLCARQQRAEHVSGSDLGDGHMAALVLYADAVQVDKRTHHHLEQLQREDRALGDLMSPFFKASDYSQIPALCC